MVQSMLAEMYVQVETMRTFTYRVLAEAAPLEIGGGGRGDIHKLTAASVMHAAQACHDVLDRAVHPWRQRLYLESEINRLFRSTKLLEIGAGTTEVREDDHRGRIAEGHGPLTFRRPSRDRPKGSDIQCRRDTTPLKLGLQDAELAVHPTVYAPGLFQARSPSYREAQEESVVRFCWPALGAHVCVVGRTQAKLEEIVGKLADAGLKASADAADIRDPMVDHLFDHLGRRMGGSTCLSTVPAGNSRNPRSIFRSKAGTRS